MSTLQCVFPTIRTVKFQKESTKGCIKQMYGEVDTFSLDLSTRQLTKLACG